MRAVEVGPDLGLVYARRNAAYGRLYDAKFVETRLVDTVVAVAGDFDPTPDDGTELVVATRSKLRRISSGESDDVALDAPTSIALRATQYSAYLMLGIDGTLRHATLRASAPAPVTIGLAFPVTAFVHDVHADGAARENLYVARPSSGAGADEIVAVRAKLYFEPAIIGQRVLASAQGTVSGLSIDGEDLLWATRSGALRRARRRIE